MSWATLFIGFFYLLTFVLGFGAMALVGQAPIKAIDKGGNAAALLLAENVAGTPFFGFIAAVAFATILAVVAGLTLSGAAALSHDLWVNVVRHGEAPEHEQLRVARIATFVMGALAIVLGIALEGPEHRLHGRARVRDRGERELPGAADVDLLARLHDLRARSSSILVGAVSALVLISISPTIQVDVLGTATRHLRAHEPGPDLDAARVRVRDPRLAAPARAARRRRASSRPSGRSTSATTAPAAARGRGPARAR